MFERVRARIAAWRTYRATVARLTALDPVILRDIGLGDIGPGDIRACARKSSGDRA